MNTYVYIYRVFFSCLTDKPWSNAPPYAFPALRRQTINEGSYTKDRTDGNL